MAIRRNKRPQTLQDNTPSIPSVRANLSEPTELSDEITPITPSEVKAQASLDKLRKLKLQFPETEPLEAGAIEQWLESRKLQLIEDADSTRTTNGIASTLGLATSIIGFAVSGSAMAALSPAIIGLGVIGYAASLVDYKARINKLFPIPFVSASPLDLARYTSPDLRQDGNDYAEEYEKLDYLPLHQARELLMLTDFHGMLLELLSRVECGKRFAIYLELREACLKYDFSTSAKQIASFVNKTVDAVAADPTIDMEVVKNIQYQISPEEETIDIEANTEPVDKLNFSLPLDEVRSEELLTNSVHVDSDLIESMTDEVANLIVCSPGGGGKGIIISNALRRFKQKHPDVHIFYIDPKADPKEKGYFENVVDTYEPFRSLGRNPKECVAAYEEMWRKFYETPGRKLLVIDEGTTLGQKYKLAKKGDVLKGRVSEIPSLAGSEGIAAWIIVQNPHTDDVGVNTGILSQFPRLALLCSNKGDAPASFDMMSRTKFTANDKYNWDDVRVLCDRSEVNRAYYYTKFGEWLPMKKLTNYSDYDRDTNTFIDKPKSAPLPQSSNTVIQSTQNTVIQTPNDDISKVLQSLLDANTTDINEAILTIYPEAKKDQLQVIINGIKDNAIRRNNQAVLSKFF